MEHQPRSLTFHVDVDMLQRTNEDDMELQAYNNIMKSVIQAQKLEHDSDGNWIRPIEDRAFFSDAHNELDNFYENALAFKNDS